MDTKSIFYDENCIIKLLEITGEYSMFKEELQQYFENQSNIITGANNLENEKGSLNSILKKYDLADGGYYKNALAYKKPF